MKRFGACALLAISTAWAGDALVRAADGRTSGAGTGMGRPILGYVARSSPPELRAILGIPGAAVFSDALPLPSEATSVRMAPGQSSGKSWAWIERGSQDPAILSLNGTRFGSVNGLAGVLPAADLAAFSPSGRSLALFSSAAGRLQVVSGLPDAPQIAQEAVLAGGVDSIAVSDDAGAVLVASGRVVQLLSPGGAAQPVLNMTSTTAMAFLPDSRDAAVVDRGAGTVHRVRSVAGGGATSGVLAAGLAGAGEISFSADGQSLLLTNPSANGVWMVSVQTGEVRSFDTRVGAAGLNRLANPETYLISSEPGQPAWIFLPGGDGAHTVFVPAAPALAPTAPGARPRRD